MTYSLPSHSAPLRLVWVTDTQNKAAAVDPGGVTRMTQVSQVARALQPDLVLFGGDLIYPDAAAGHTADACYADWEQAWSWLLGGPTPSIPWYVAPGNHDLSQPDAHGAIDPDLLRAFDTRFAGHYLGRAGAGQHYGVLALANGWRVYVLEYWDADVIPGDGAGGGAPEMEAWFARALADPANRDRPAIVVTHAPRYSKGRVLEAAGLARLWMRAQAAGVDVWLSGHNHCYERWPLRDGGWANDSAGIRQFVGPPGGHSLSMPEAGGQEARRGDVFGCLALDLARDAYTWRLVGIDGQVEDSGEQATHHPT